MLGPLQQGEPLTLDCKVQVDDQVYHLMFFVNHHMTSVNHQMTSVNHQMNFF